MRTILQKLLSKTITKQNGCMEFTGAKTKFGYGWTSYKGKQMTAHRAVLIEKTGKNPGSKVFACHTCDNPPCINPDHLWWGSVAENARDMKNKGRSDHINCAQRITGSRNPGAKIDLLTAFTIKQLANSGHSVKELSREYKLSVSQIYRIKNGQRWRNAC